MSAAPVSDVGLLEFPAFATLIIVILIFTVMLFDWTHLCHIYECVMYDYSYGGAAGPLEWKEKFPNSTGGNQSPIDIETTNVMVVPFTAKPLTFSREYHSTTLPLKVYNDGHTLILYPHWVGGAKPTIQGGPLNDTYEFCNARFRWGPTDAEGSEHLINSKRYPLELQAVHVKAGKRYRSVKHAAEDNALAIISYVFEVTLNDNGDLDSLTSVLDRIVAPFNCATVVSAPLSWYMPPFSSKYYSYQGSLTFPPCTEGVEWIVNPSPLEISSRQLMQFRDISDVDGVIKTNSRPVQELNNRNVFYYE